MNLRETMNLVDAIPEPEKIRQRLAELHTERQVLKKLLRLAVQLQNPTSRTSHNQLLTSSKKSNPPQNPA